MGESAAVDILQQAHPTTDSARGGHKCQTRCCQAANLKRGWLVAAKDYSSKVFNKADRRFDSFCRICGAVSGGNCLVARKAVTIASSELQLELSDIDQAEHLSTVAPPQFQHFTIPPLHSLDLANTSLAPWAYDSSAIDVTKRLRKLQFSDPIKLMKLPSSLSIHDIIHWQVHFHLKFPTRRSVISTPTPTPKSVTAGPSRFLQPEENRNSSFAPVVLASIWRKTLTRLLS